MSEEKLIEMLEKNPKKGHSLLIETYGGYVYAVVADKLRDLCSNEDIEDCVSDIFVELFTGIHSYDRSKGTLKAYISVIAKRVAINAYNSTAYRRNNTISTDSDEAVILKTVENPCDDLDKKAFRQRLWEIVDSLGEPDSKIIVWQYFYGLKLSDIAEKMVMSVGAVQKRSVRARKRIKQILEKEYGKVNCYE